MTILPKNFSGAKKTHRKPTSSQADHSGHSKAHVKKVVVERQQPRHVIQSAQTQEEPLNSDDEYGTGFKDESLEAAFIANMKTSRGFDVKEVKGDGACLFRAVADQIYGDEEMHHDVRRLCMDYVAKNRDHFSQFITEDFNEYLERKRRSDEHGNHLEIQAISEIFLRPIEIYEYHTEPINTFHPISREANNRQENPPIRLSYHGSIHYNSIVDPFTPTIGVGLGLANYIPGHADQSLMSEAKLASERQQIEEAMLKDKLRMTDWERTEEELERQIASESYMDYLRQIERQSEQKRAKSNDKTSVYKSSQSNQADSSHVSRINAGKSPIQQETHRPISKASSPPKFGLGSKRGASSPNLPCTSRQIEDNACPAPLTKIHRTENTSASLPNLGSSFGDSYESTCASSSFSKPQKTESAESTEIQKEQNTPLPLNEISDESQAGTSKQHDEEPKPTIGLYEELLASSTAYGDWNETDDASMLAQVIALSQQDFLDNLKKSPRQ